MSVADKNLPGISYKYAKCIAWLTSQFEHLIEAKKEEMFRIRSGSLTSGEPKLIWIGVLPSSKDADFEAMRLKYNGILEDILSTRKNSYIYYICPDKIVDFTNFDRSGHLDASGRVTFWKHVDANLFD